jgi:ubiquinone/menaquinone biosynthesis C-methylase UbiE
MPKESETVESLEDRYRFTDNDAYRDLQRSVFGASTWVNGYTTVAQTEEIAERLGLKSGVRLLDVGAGQGWPSVYLAKKTGCSAILADPPAAGLRSALARASDEGVSARCAYARASGTRLPFRASVFDVLVHTDTL